MLRQQAEQARQREREALALYEVARLVPGSTLDLQPLLGLILDQLKTIVEYDAATVILRDATGDAVVAAVGESVPPDTAHSELAVPLVIKKQRRPRGAVTRPTAAKQPSFEDE